MFKLLVGYPCLDILNVTPFVTLRPVCCCVLMNGPAKERGHHIRKRRWFWVKLQYLERLGKPRKHKNALYT